MRKVNISYLSYKGQVDYRNILYSMLSGEQLIGKEKRLKIAERHIIDKIIDGIKKIPSIKSMLLKLNDAPFLAGRSRKVETSENVNKQTL